MYHTSITCQGGWELDSIGSLFTTLHFWSLCVCKMLPVMSWLREDYLQSVICTTSRLLCLLCSCLRMYARRCLGDSGLGDERLSLPSQTTTKDVFSSHNLVSEKLYLRHVGEVSSSSVVCARVDASGALLCLERRDDSPAHTTIVRERFLSKITESTQLSNPLSGPGDSVGTVNAIKGLSAAVLQSSPLQHGSPSMKKLMSPSKCGTVLLPCCFPFPWVISSSVWWHRDGTVDLGTDSVADAPLPASDAPSSVGVQVVLRCRPLLPRELSEGAQSILTCRRNEVEVAKYAAYVQRKAYLFHRVFGEATQQRHLYKDTVLPVVRRALDGYNCTVFAYGQTGTGKTFTLEGDIPKLTDTATPSHESVRVYCGVYCRICMVGRLFMRSFFCHRHSAVASFREVFTRCLRS